jgi:hypothetical protein
VPHHPLLARVNGPWVSLLTLVLVIGVLWAAKAVLLPLALGIVLAFTLTPLVRQFDRWRLPRFAGVALTMLLALGAVGGIGYVVFDQFADLSAQMAKYTSSMRRKVADLHMSDDAGHPVTAPADGADAPASAAAMHAGAGTGDDALVHAATDERGAGATIVGLAARTPADQLVLEMLQAARARKDIEAVPLPLAPDQAIAQTIERHPALVCVAAISPTRGAEARNYCRHLRSALPAAKVLVLRPHPGEAEMSRSTARMKEAGADVVVASAKEAIEAIENLLADARSAVTACERQEQRASGTLATAR